MLLNCYLNLFLLGPKVIGTEPVQFCTPGFIPLADQLQVFILISLKIIVNPSKNRRWIIGGLKHLIIYNNCIWFYSNVRSYNTRTSNLRIPRRVGSNPGRGKPLLPWARHFTLIARYWLVPWTDSRVFLLAFRFLHNRT